MSAEFAMQLLKAKHNTEQQDETLILELLILNNAITFDLFLPELSILHPNITSITICYHTTLLTHFSVKTKHQCIIWDWEKKAGCFALDVKSKTKMLLFSLFSYKNILKSPSCFAGVPHFFLLYVFRLVFLGELYRYIFKTAFEQN